MLINYQLSISSRVNSRPPGSFLKALIIKFVVNINEKIKNNKGKNNLIQKFIL